MHILGYGEDALTLAAFTHDLPGVLRQLQDQSSPENVVVLYRPSFGRRSAAPAGTPRSEFGEFDGIIITDAAAYLVEAKWVSSSEVQGEELTLRPEQTRRHRILRGYLQLWVEHRPDSWSTFRERTITEFEGLFPGATIPRDGTTLAKNLEFVLRLITSKPRSVVDVLLFSAPIDGIIAVPKSRDDFRLVTFQVPSIGGAGYIPMLPGGSNMLPPSVRSV